MTFRSNDEMSESARADDHAECGGCPLLEDHGRRAFLRDAAGYFAAVAALASLGASTAHAQALPVRGLRRREALGAVP